MRVLVKMGLLPSEALTTAWFVVEQVFHWFTLMTSRYTGTAMSLFKETSHKEAVAFFEEIMTMALQYAMRHRSSASSLSRPGYVLLLPVPSS